MDHAKTCTRCGELKLLKAFSKQKSGKNGISARCTTCCSSVKKQWAKENPDRNRNNALLYNFSISLSQYNQLLIDQNHKCAICSEDQKNLNSALCVDHCHTSNKIRGLLCKKCNTAIGLLKDNVQTVNKAAIYLNNAYRRSSNES